jgi:hypothetical protein
VPSYRYTVPVLYWLGRAMQELGNKSAPDQFKRFLSYRPEPSPDPLAADARRRLATGS